MAFTVIYPVPYAPASEPSYTGLEIIPPTVACPQYPILNFTASLGVQWNCQRCIHAPYYGAFERGDKIPIQLNLRDDRNGILFPPATVSRPQVGWRQTDLVNNFWYITAELYDGNTSSPTLIYSLAEQFCSDFWVGYSNVVGSVQTLIIDTSLLPISLDSFRVKIRTIDAAGADVITLWSEPFCIVNDCTPSVVITGQYSTVDCYNRDYRQPSNDAGSELNYLRVPFTLNDTPPEPFYASWRFLGAVWQTAFTGEKELNDNNKVVRSKSIETSRLAIAEAIPLYAAQILAAMLQSAIFTVDGVVYDEASDVAKNIDAGLAFLPAIDLIKTCQINNNKCN